MFLRLLSTTCEKNPDVFLLFFGQVYRIEENLELNQVVLDTVRAIIENEKMSIYMLNFAGYLNKVYNVPFQRAIAGFENISLQAKECPYVMVYLLRNYPDQLQQIAQTVTKKIAETKPDTITTTVLFSSCNIAISEAESHEVLSKAADLYVEILAFYDSVNRRTDFHINLDLALLTATQVQSLVALYVSLDLAFNFTQVNWDNIFAKHSATINAFSSAFLQIYIGKGILLETIQKLTKLEESILKRVARANNLKFYQEEKK